MAGIQTVDSAGKTTLALLGIGKQIQAGQTSQAKSNLLWLKNEIAKTNLTNANREIQQLTSKIDKATSDRIEAEQKLQAATFDNFKALEEEKRKNQANLNAANIEHLKVQDATKRQAWEAKRLYETAPERGQDMRRDAEIQRLEKIISDGGTLTPEQQQNLRELRLLDAGRDPAGFTDRMNTAQDDSLLTEWIGKLDEKGTLTPPEASRLYMMKMARVGQLQNVNAANISEMFKWNVTEHELNQIKRDIEIAKTQPNSEARVAQLMDKRDDVREARADPERYQALVTDQTERYKADQTDATTREIAQQTDATERYKADKTAETDRFKAQTTAETDRYKAELQYGDKAIQGARVYNKDTSDWAKAKATTFRSGTPEEIRSMWNSHPVVSGLNLPSAFKVKNNNIVVPDKHIGGFKWDNPRDAQKQRAFASSFLTRLVSQLREKGYTPQGIQMVLGDLDEARNIMNAGVASSENIGGVEGIVHTYANIAQYQPNMLKAFRQELSVFANQQPVKEQTMTNPDATDVEKGMSLWQGFGSWATSEQARMQPGTSDGTTTTQPGDTESGKSYRYWKDGQFHDMRVDNVVRDAQGRIKEIISGGQRQAPPSNMLEHGANVPLPNRYRLFEVLPAGTPIIVEGQQYRYHGLVKGDPKGLARFEVTDDQGNVRRFRVDTKNKFLPGGQFSTPQINRLLKGIADTSSGAKRMLERRKAKTPFKPSNPLGPSSEKATPKAQKKNKGTVTATTTWETVRDGGRLLRLDAQGRAFATVLNLRKAGQKGKGLPGIYDADTLYGVEVELPDWDKDSMPDSRVELEGGKVVELPEVWKNQEYTANGNSVRSKDAVIRLAGVQATEVYFPPPNQGQLNPAGVRAQEELVRMFQQGWVDRPAGSNTGPDRFIFKVRVVGSPDSVPTQLKHKYPNPYSDKYGRIITDVYVAVGGKEQKIAEVTWENPEKKLIQQGHGRPWQWK